MQRSVVKLTKLVIVDFCIKVFGENLSNNVLFVVLASGMTLVLQKSHFNNFQNKKAVCLHILTFGAHLTTNMPVTQIKYLKVTREVL